MNNHWNYPMFRHMQSNMNLYNNNSSNNNLIMNMANKPTYGTSNKKFGNGRYNQAAHIPVSNINYNKNLSNSFYRRNNGNDNYNNINRSFDYISHSQLVLLMSHKKHH